MKAERIKLREAGRRCERGERCTQAILVADRLGLYDIGIRYARLDCERSGRPCFMAGHLAAKAQYNDETIFWNIVDSCTQSIDGVPCNAFKAEGYQEQTFFELLSMRVGRTTVEELIFPQTN
ncbi:MAG TPA: hypothetical protein VM432_13410 [Bdellovibrionales bacterium]|nr:hypothetical protein [Bdellovibrionales bacterium]